MDYLDDDTVFELADDTPVVVETAGKDPAPVRRLKAQMRRTEKWIRGAGAHHRSKSGHHGSSAVETHSSAHVAKKHVREHMAAQLNEMAEEVSQLGDYETVAAEAKKLAKAVLAK